MIGDNDAVGTGFHRLLCRFCGHDAFYDKGFLRTGLQVFEILYGFGTRAFPLELPVAESGAVHDDTERKGAARLEQFDLFADALVGQGVQHGNHAGGGVTVDRVECAGHRAHGESVAETVNNPGLGTGLNHAVIERDGNILSAVLCHRADGSRHQRQAELPAKKRAAGVNRTVRGKGVDVEFDGLPAFPVVVGTVPGSLGTGAGQGVDTAESVAFRTGLAVQNGFSGVGKNFFVLHGITSAHDLNVSTISEKRRHGNKNLQK